MFKTISKINIILSVMLLLIAGSLFLCAQSNNLENNKKMEESIIKNISKACFKDKCFNVEIADAPEEKRVGLMNRNHLDPDGGMLFVFEKAGNYNFWMKNVLIPLDMIWIGEGNKIIFIKENAEPCKTEQCELFGSNEKALYVLEINGGMAEKMEFEIGDEIELKLL